MFTVHDLRNRTGELIREAELGHLSLITKHGQPVVDPQVRASFLHLDRGEGVRLYASGQPGGARADRLLYQAKLALDGCEALPAREKKRGPAPALICSWLVVKLPVTGPRAVDSSLGLHDGGCNLSMTTAQYRTYWIS